MYWESSAFKWDNFESDVNLATNDLAAQLNGLKWNNELSLSAGWYAEEISGCNLYAPTLFNDLSPSHFIR
jgi:hypothetical protein